MIQESLPSLDQVTDELQSNPESQGAISQPSQSPSTSIPVPWLWMWLAVYLLQIGDLFRTYINPYLQSIFVGDDGSTSRTLFSELSVRGISLMELIPYIIVLFGVLSLFFPKQRAARLERDYSLKDLDGEQLPEIRVFLARQAPNLKIKVNLARMDQYAFVYPTGYRSFAIAIFGPLARLWRQDPEAAKAVLLHEVAHYRSGDGHIQGTGTLFTSYLRSWLLIYFVSLILPYLLIFVSSTAPAVFEFFQNGSITSILDLLFSVLGMFIPVVIGASASVFLATLSIIFIPLMGVWLAELNADFYASQILGDVGAVKRALGYVGKRPSLFVWFLRRMTHPPEFLRRLVLGMRNRELSLSVILLMMPLAYLFRMLILSIQLIVLNIVVQFLTGQVVTDQTLSLIMRSMGHGLLIISGILLFASFLLLTWPWLAPRWQSIFTHQREGIITRKTPYFLDFGLTFGLVFFLAMVGGILQLVFR